MRNTEKEKAKMGRAEAVQRLRSLAQEIEQGTIRFGDRTFRVPDQVRLKIEASNDELEIDLKWKAGAAEEAGIKSQPAHH